jgi:hypothetical protein
VVLWLSNAGMIPAVRHSVHSALSSTRRVIASAGAVVLCVVVDVVGPTTRSVTVWVFVETEVSVEITVTVARVQRTSSRSLVDEVVGWVGSLFPKCML